MFLTFIFYIFMNMKTILLLSLLYFSLSLNAQKPPFIVPDGYFTSLKQAQKIPKKEVVHLDLYSKNLKKFPRVILSFPNLRRLNLNFNKLESLPDDISKLQNLEELMLSSNKITELPASIVQLKKLRELNLSKNRLKTLPLELKQLQKLDFLWIDGNSIPKKSILQLEAWLPNCSIYH